MSEQRKRFPDEVIAAGHEVLASLVFACDPEDCEHSGDEGSDGAGYCDAEDQRRLVDAVATDQLQARGCCETGRLLAEVDPT